MSEDDEQLINTSTEPIDTDPAEFGCLGDNVVCNPTRRLHRFIVLAFICFLSFGSYYCYDNPAALAPQFKSDLGLEGTNYMLLYSLYSWPNVFLCFIGGYLIDKVFGIRLGAFLFGLVILIGQIIFAIGAYMNSAYVMYAGRFVFGLGGENLAVAGNTYVVSWFGGKEINTVFGIQLSFSRIGSTVGMVTLLPFYNALAPHFGDNKAHLMGTLLCFGAGLCMLSLAASVILALLDRRAKRILKKEAGGTGESIKLSDITRFSPATWLIFGICVSYYVAIFPFISLGKLFFQQKFGLTPAEAGICNSLVYFIGAGASPIAGLLIDHTGRNVMWLLSAILLTLGAYALLAFTFVHPYVAMVIMAIAYAMCASALWPMVSLVVPEYQLGTAYGMMQSIQNLGLALVGLAAGAIVGKYGYFLLALQFMAWLALSAVFILMLWVWDARTGGYLNATPAKRKEMHDEEVQAVLVGEEYREPLISDNSVLDVSQSFRAATARELRHKYLTRIEEGGGAADFTQSVKLEGGILRALLVLISAWLIVQQFTTPTWEMSDPKICFVIGGPGSGKGTQCELLVEKHGLAHFSSGDLLRAEVASGSQRGKELQAVMKEGKLVDMDVVIELLKEAVMASHAAHPDKIILLDGFPREMEQAVKFEAKICSAKYVLSFDCSNETMTSRLLSRAQTSGRADDNIETIKKRLVTFEQSTAPVLQHYKSAGRLVNVSAEDQKDAIFANTCKGLGL